MWSEIIIDGLNIFWCLQLISESLIAESFVMQNTNYEFSINNFSTISPVFQYFLRINQILERLFEVSLPRFEDSFFLEIEQIIKKLGWNKEEHYFNCRLVIVIWFDCIRSARLIIVWGSWYSSWKPVCLNYWFSCIINSMDSNIC